MQDRVRELIVQYLAQVHAAMRIFEHAGFPRPLEAVRAGLLSRQGAIGGLEYSFHGMGCSVRSARGAVDFDFGPHGRFDGFDAWRLWRFACANAADEGLSEAAIADELRAAVAAGFVIEPRWLPTPTLLYLADA